MTVGYKVRVLPETVRKSTSGFTLLELIVVIGVIGILVAILFPAVAGMREKARAKEAAVTQKALEIAIRSFRTQYGYWPGPTPDSYSIYTNSDQATLINYLLSTSSGLNPSMTPFWETPGIVTNTSTKQPFTIIIDATNNTVTVQ